MGFLWNIYSSGEGVVFVFTWTLNRKSNILEILKYFYICPSSKYQLRTIDYWGAIIGARYHELK